MTRRVDPMRTVLIVLLVVYAVIVVRNAWISDDAYITFRTIENFTHGYGLTWNVGERVQTYTHPLWLFVLTIFYIPFRQIYPVAMFISLLCSLGAVTLMAFKLIRPAAAAAVAILVLALSDAFVDYSTSGLENPLSFLLLVLFLYIFFERKAGVKSLFYLALTASLILINRMDVILLCLPALAYAFWKIRSRRAFYALAAGFTPFILWELFSLFYYGFPFPNTAYAKLGMGIDNYTLMRQGWYYIRNSLNIDYLTVLVILAALIIPFFARKRKSIPVALGILLTILYIIKIGGDFMSGRLLAAPLLVAVIVLGRHISTLKIRNLGLIAAAVLVAGLTTSHSPAYGGGETEAMHAQAYLYQNVVDERLWWYPKTGLLRYRTADTTWPAPGWPELDDFPPESSMTVEINSEVGMDGFGCGPKKHIIDPMGLADPLLARLPVRPHVRYKPGHYLRRIPEGYERSILENRDAIVDGNLAVYYGVLRHIITGPLFDWSRIKDIVAFNLGNYDKYKRPYIDHYIINASIVDFGKPKKPGTMWNHPTNIIFDSTGVIVYLENIYHSDSMEISRDNNDSLRAEYMLGDTTVAEQIVPPHPIPEGGLSTSVIAVPSEAARRGFDRIRFIPIPGDGMYAIGHIRLF